MDDARHVISPVNTRKAVHVIFVGWPTSTDTLDGLREIVGVAEKARDFL